MSVKLFLLGRPGCGKSRTAKYVVAFIKNNGWDWITSNFKDYDILYEMAQKDVLHKKFHLYEDGSFDVKDPSVLDEALWIVEDKVRKHYRSIDAHQSSRNELIIIELARGDYDEAFSQLSQDLLQDAYFLLINAEFETCVQRIHERIISPASSDDHNVSDKAMNRYYLEQHPPTDPEITGVGRYWEVENQGKWDNFTEKIEPIIKGILKIR